LRRRGKEFTSCHETGLTGDVLEWSTMRAVNRATIVVRPRQPYVDWANSIDEDEETHLSLEEHREDPTAYLIPLVEDEEQAEEILVEGWPLLFENELESWCAEEEAWPADRSLEMFLEWFDVELHSTVVDVAADALEGEDL
jgi:hypothetical protein